MSLGANSTSTAYGIALERSWCQRIQWRFGRTSGLTEPAHGSFTTAFGWWAPWLGLVTCAWILGSFGLDKPCVWTVDDEFWCSKQV
jgi:hypothetical protein